MSSCAPWAALLSLFAQACLACGALMIDPQVWKPLAAALLVLALGALEAIAG